MHTRLLDRVREVVAPIQVEQSLGHGAKDATPSRAAEGQVHFRGGRVVHDQRRCRRERSLAAFRVVERRSCATLKVGIKKARVNACISVRGLFPILGCLHSVRRNGGTSQNSRRRPNASGNPGVEKSSISSLRMMPVLVSMTREPKIKLTVVVSETAPPHWSMTER